MAKHIEFFVVLFLAFSATAAQVRVLPEILVASSDEPKKVRSVCAVTLADHTLRNAAAMGESVDASAFEGLSADVALSWNGDGISVAVAGRSRGVGGDFVLKRDGAAARFPIVNGRAFAPWSRFSPAGETPESMECLLDLEWDGLYAGTLRKMPRDVRRQSVHTSMAALTAKPALRFNPHLPRPEMWGRMRFGMGEELPAQRRGGAEENGNVLDFSEIGCFAGSRTVDGRLDDWRRGGFRKAAILPDMLGDRYAAEFAAAFDGNFLYLAVKVSHPDGNPVNTAMAESGAGYGGGDALQIRISPDGTKAQSFCAWLSPTGPALTVDTNDPEERNLLKRGAKLAFGKTAGGYAMEVAVPWNVIGRSAKNGDEWRMTFQPWWNAAGKRFAFFAPLKLARPPAKRVEVESPRAGAVSLGVFDAGGKLVRTLLKGDWRDKLALSEEWDLKDQWGEYVRPGEYVLKGLVTDGASARYRNSVLNPGTPAWPTADGRGDWLSDEAPPQGVATDGRNIFVAAPGSEKGYAVMAIGPDKKRIWGVGEQFYPRCVSLSYLDGKLYALFSGPIKDASAAQKGGKAGAMGRAVIIAYDAMTGRHVDFSAKNPRTELGGRWPYREEATLLCDLISRKAFAPGKYIGQPRYFADGVGETDNAIGFAALPGLFAVSKFYDNKVEFYDSATLGKRGEVAVDAPAGLCRVGENALLAVSGKNVVRVDLSTSSFAKDTEDRKNTKVTKIISDGLAAPVAVTVDKAGTIYVSDWAGEMCVKKFSSDGRMLGIVGKRGGRPWIGKFENDGMLLPHGLAVTDAGTLFVAEAEMNPKRVSAWDADSGKFIRHWIGPAPYGGMSSFWVDPDEQGFVHAMGCKFSYDMKSGAWDIAATEIRRMDRNQPFTPSPESCIGTGVKVVKRGGETYICTGRRYATVWMRKKGDVFVPCAAVGGLHSLLTDDGTGLSTWDSGIGRHLYRNVRPEFFRGHSGKRGRAGDNYAWSDLNGDGIAQPDEMTWCETLTRSDLLSAMDEGGAKKGCQCEFRTEWGAIPASDGTLHFAGFAKDGDCIWQLKPTRWGEFGPVYDICRANAIYREAGQGGQFSGVWTDEDGNVFAVGKMKNVRDVKSRSALIVLSGDGSVKWEFAAPKARDEKDFAGSGVSGTWKIPGIGEVVCIWNWWWNFRPYFVTADGLYVGTFGEETSLGPAALWGESATYFFQTKDGRPFLVNGANQAAHIFSVEGLANAKRFYGRVTVAESDIDDAKKSGRVAARRAPPKDILDFCGNVAKANGGKGRGWRISLSSPFGSDALRVEADVDDPSPMLQPGTDFRTLFITGDCVDLMLATGPDAPKDRRRAAAGDKRVLFSEICGKGVAVLYEPVAKVRPDRPERLMAAEIDAIRIVENASVAIERRADGTGYRLTAEVPLSEIGLVRGDTRTLRGDVGVVFSGETGGRELRLYHYNEDTSMTSDLTTEATLQPHEWGNILRPQGENLVKDPTFGKGSSPFLIETTNHVSIGQTITLPEGCGGKTANIRLLMRSSGLKPEERKAAGKPGAFIKVCAFVKDSAGKTIAQQFYRRETDVWNWTPCTRMARHDRIDADDAISVPLPKGAVKVRMDFKLTSRGQSVPARVWIDAVEVTVK